MALSVWAPEVLPWFSKCGAEQDLFQQCTKPDGFYFLLAMQCGESRQLLCSLLSVGLHL